MVWTRGGHCYEHCTYNLFKGSLEENFKSLSKAANRKKKKLTFEADAPTSLLFMHKAEKKTIKYKKREKGRMC